MGTVDFTDSQYHGISQGHVQSEATTLSARTVPPTEQETNILLRYFYSVSHPPTLFNQLLSDWKHQTKIALSFEFSIKKELLKNRNL